jgi:Co/Zn/Cd efflux system component
LEHNTVPMWTGVWVGTLHKTVGLRTEILTRGLPSKIADFAHSIVMEVFKGAWKRLYTSFSILLGRKFRKVNSEKQSDKDQEANPVPNFHKLHYVA